MLDHKNTSHPFRSCPTCSWFKTRWLSVLDHKNPSHPLRSCPTCSWFKNRSLSVPDHKNTSQPLRSCPTCCWFKTHWLSVPDHNNSPKPLICRMYPTCCWFKNRSLSVPGHSNIIGKHTATPLHAYTHILRPVDCRINARQMHDTTAGPAGTLQLQCTAHNRENKSDGFTFTARRTQAITSCSALCVH